MAGTSAHEQTAALSSVVEKAGGTAAATFSFTSDCTTPGLSAELEEEKPSCWICFSCETAARPLTRPCSCPRDCHQECLARWQLQSAGTRRETRCEFCDEVLPDWRRTLTPESGANAPAIMNVNFDGRTYSFEVAPGLSGYFQFTAAIRHAFQLSSGSDLNITFTCDEPTSSGDPHGGNILTLQGPGAYDAAVYCASVSAARRRQSRHNHRTVSSPNLRSPLENRLDNVPEDYSRLQRSQTVSQSGQVYRPEEFLLQEPEPISQVTNASIIDGTEEIAGGRRGRKIVRRLNRLGFRIKALFNRMKK